MTKAIASTHGSPFVMHPGFNEKPRPPNHRRRSSASQGRHIQLDAGPINHKGWGWRR